MNEHANEHELSWHISYWPLLVSVGALFLAPLSFIFHFVYHNTLMSALSLGIGVPLTLISIIGWVREGIEDKHGYSAGHSVWAMPLFIVAEALFFAGFFVAYWVLRLTAKSWPPAGTPHMEYAIPVLMTIILVASSVTIHFAERCLEKEVEDRSGFKTWLIVTLILGAIFVALSAYEWSALISGGFGASTNVYSTAFYSITGLHA
ncbi:heme-copper oxidase subunit III, partial [bacterium]